MKKGRLIYSSVFALSFTIVIVILMAFSKDSLSSKEKKIEEKETSLINQKLAEKLKRFRTTILKKCKREAIEEAELLVDSLVAEEYRMLSNDTIAFPSKPIRPSLPQKIILNDTTTIDPILSGS